MDSKTNQFSWFFYFLMYDFFISGLAQARLERDDLGQTKQPTLNRFISTQARTVAHNLFIQMRNVCEKCIGISFSKKRKNLKIIRYKWPRSFIGSIIEVFNPKTLQLSKSKRIEKKRNYSKWNIFPSSWVLVEHLPVITSGNNTGFICGK